MQIAEACLLAELKDDLLAVALDHADDPHIRAHALAALRKCGDESLWPTLRPLALDEAGPDPRNDIKGQALAILWPKYLGSADVFQHLGRPLESYHGSYATFIANILPTTLSPQDLPTALLWATSFVRGNERSLGDFNRKGLADSIFRLAWDQVCTPEITKLVFDYLTAVIGTHHQLFIGIARETNEEFLKRVAEDDDGRHALLRIVLNAPRDSIFLVGLVRSGLIVPADFAWLLSLSPEGSGNFD